MSTIAIELCHGYYRAAFSPTEEQLSTKVYYTPPSGMPFLGSGTRGTNYKDVAVLTEDMICNEEHPADAFILPDGSISFDYQKDHMKIVSNIFDRDVLLSGHLTSMSGKYYSGEDLMVAFFQHIKDVFSHLTDTPDSVCVIIPNSYTREKYVLASAAGAAGLRIRLFTACDALAYAYTDGNENIEPDGEFRFSTMNIGYHGIDVACHLYDAHVIETPSAVTLSCNYLSRFVDAIHHKIMTQLFDDDFWRTSKKPHKDMSIARLEAIHIAQSEELIFPYTVPAHLFDHKAQSPIIFTWEELTAMASFILMSDFDLGKLVERLDLSAFGAWSDFTDTLIVAGEGCAWPAMQEAILKIARNSFQHVHLCNDEPYSIVEITRYRASKSPNALLLMSSSAGVSLAVVHTRLPIVNPGDVYPLLREYEIDLSETSNLGLCFYEGDDPILWGEYRTHDHKKATMRIDGDHSGIIEVTLTFDDGSKATLSHRYIEISQREYFPLPNYSCFSSASRDLDSPDPLSPVTTPL